MNKTEKGREGERIAAAYMEKCGMTILARNYRSGKSEIDIVAQDCDTLVFAEIKARTHDRFGSGAEAVTYKKQKMLVAGAYGYCEEFDKYDAKMRFDVIEVDLNTKLVSNHIKDAFYAEE